MEATHTHQHIHAGYWKLGIYTTHRYTFRTVEGFERWSRRLQAQGCAVQWRFCDEPDQRPAWRAAPALCRTAEAA